MWKSKAYRSYYDVLNLQKDCTTEDIQKSYLKLSKIYHPDKNIGKEYSHVEFVNIREAYTTLKNPDKRKRYDYYLSHKYYKKFEKYDEYHKNHGYVVDLSSSYWNTSSSGKFKDSYLFRLVLMPKALLLTTFIFIVLFSSGQHMILLRNNSNYGVTHSNDSFITSLIYENAKKQRALRGVEEQKRRLREGTLGIVDVKKIVNEYYEKFSQNSKNK